MVSYIIITDLHTNAYITSLIFLKLNIVLFRQVNNLIIKLVVEPYAAQWQEPKEFKEQENLYKQWMLM